jgi:hypothetical protein
MTVPPLRYVYGVVAPGFPLQRSPRGLEEAPLRLVEDDALSAVVSELDGVRYAPDAVEHATENVEWLAARAVAHDRILTWASDQGPLVPLPMFTLFSSDEAVRAMLRERAAELTAALRRAGQGREYALRVYRVDAELSPVAAEMSPRLAELQRAADAASPGQRYLLERKLEAERRDELHGIGQRLARDIVADLSKHALATADDSSGRRADGAGAGAALVLDAAFLVAPERLDNFRGALTALVERHRGRGFRFDFTGPWPLFHFVHGAGERDAGGA